MKDFRYEELKEIRRGLGVLFLLVLTYLGDLLKEYAKELKPLEKEIMLVKITAFFLLVLFLGIILITGIIWLFNKQKEHNNG